MASSDAKPVPQKNVAYRITFPLLDADGDLVTGATGLDSEVSKDGGTFADCTNEATEIATSSGVYYLDLTSTEMNADTVAVIIKTSTSGAKTTTIVLYPEEAGDIRVNVTAFGGTAGTFASGRPEVNTTHLAGTSQTARDIGASVLLSSGTGTGQVTLTSGRVNADLTHIAAAAVSTGTAQLGVNVVNFGGSAGTFASGVPAVNATQFGGATVTATTSVTFPAASTVATTTGAVGSVTGAVGSVTGNVGGNVTGSVGSISGVTFPTNFSALGINASGHVSRVVLCDTITTYTGNTVQTGDSYARIGATGSGLTSLAPASTALSTATWTGTLATNLATTNSTVATNLDAAISTRLAPTTAGRTLDVSAGGEAGIDWANIGSPTTAQNLTGTNILSAQAVTTLDGGALDNNLTSIASAVWDAGTADYGIAGSYGLLVETNLNATVGSRASQTSVDTIDDYLDTEIAAIKAKTDQLTFTTANKVDGTLQAAGDIAAAVCQKIAHILLRRTMANVEASSDGDTLDLSSLYGLIQMAQEASASGGTLTVKRTDGSTTLGTKTLTATAGADPITAIA